MTRSEYEKRTADAAAFQKLVSMPEWLVVDELLVKILDDSSKSPMLAVPREKLECVYDMLNGQQACILLIKSAIMEWTSDLGLRPEMIDEEPSPHASE